MKLAHNNHASNESRSVMLVGAAALLIALIGIIERHFPLSCPAQRGEDLARVRVTIIHAEPAPKERRLDLPANFGRLVSGADLCAVSGYVKSGNKDYGAHVKTGDILAEISTPGLDAQYEAAKANYEVVAAQYRLAFITAETLGGAARYAGRLARRVDVQAQMRQQKRRRWIRRAMRLSASRR